MSKQFGVNVWWTVPEISPVDGQIAHAVLRKYGFSPEEDMPLPSEKAAVSRAAYSFQDRRHKDGRRVTEKAQDNGEKVVYGVLDYTQKDIDEVSYDQGTKIILDKATGTVNVEGELREEVLRQIDEYRGTLTDDDVRQFLRGVIRKCYGLAKRPTGGIYFVPEQYLEVVENAQKALDRMGLGAKLYIERIVDGQQERDIVWDSVTDTVTSEIDKVLANAERVEKRVKSVQGYQENLVSLDDLMQVYTDLLGYESEYEELKGKLNAASNRLAGKIRQLRQKQSGEKKQGKSVKTPAKSASKTKKKASRKPVGNIMEHVHTVLDEAGPMHYREIAEKLRERGVNLRQTQRHSPESWLQVQMYKASRRGELERVERGTYQEAEKAAK